MRTDITIGEFMQRKGELEASLNDFVRPLMKKYTDAFRENTGMSIKNVAWGFSDDSVLSDEYPSSNPGPVHINYMSYIL